MRQQRKLSKQAVFSEQLLQWISSNDNDAEAIAKKYSCFTKKCELYARKVGLQDEKDAYQQ